MDAAWKLPLWTRYFNLDKVDMKPTLHYRNYVGETYLCVRIGYKPSSDSILSYLTSNSDPQKSAQLLPASSWTKTPNKSLAVSILWTWNAIN